MSIESRGPRDLHWSSAEKKIARAAYDAALAREKAAARRTVIEMLQRSEDPDCIWEVYEFLRTKGREMDDKYDYRYSVLPRVFRRLANEGWLSPGDLSGLAPEKLVLILGDLVQPRT